jgi:multisubunit Na+/H+ antiporter MnhB subunit
MTRPLALAALLLFASALAIALVLASLRSPAPTAGLPERVAAELPASGVRHPVTAVLLNFRAYDTLLEVAVLLAAWLGAGAIARPRAASADADATEPAPPLLSALWRLLAPLLLLVAGYLLWRGEHAPGGAFHAGALLGAAAVLASLAAVRLRLAHAQTALLVAGLALFVAIGFATLVARGVFLGYPPDAAGALIFAIEVAAALSIGAALALLFDAEALR